MKWKSKQNDYRPPPNIQMSNGFDQVLNGIRSQGKPNTYNAIIHGFSCEEKLENKL